ncbi:MAG: NAD(P)H-binding protein [Chloroflexota bacterium]
MILVAGGTGTLGRSLIPRLLARGESVRVLTRGVPTQGHALSAGVDTVIGDVRDREAVDRAMTGVRTVVSAIQGFGGPGAGGVRAIDGQGNANLIAAAEAAGVDQFVLLSIGQASPDHPSELFRVKAETERRLQASSLAWTIVRPTAYQETWLELVGRPLVETGRTRIFGRGRNPINFVSVEDVAGIVDLALSDLSLRGSTIEVAGPEDLTFEAFVATVREVTQAAGTVGHVPLPMMRLLATALRPVKPILASRIATAVVMDTRDMTADATHRARRFPSVPVTPLATVVARRLPVARGALADRPA